MAPKKGAIERKSRGDDLTIGNNNNSKQKAKLLITINPI